MAEKSQKGANHLNTLEEEVKKLSPVAMAWRATSWLIKYWKVIPITAIQSNCGPYLVIRWGQRMSSPVPIANPITTIPTPSAFDQCGALCKVLCSSSG